MHRLLILAVALVFAVGCDDSPTTPSDPNQFKFTAALLPANEVPTAVTNAEASGRGTATVTMNVTKDAAGTITAATYDFTVDLTGFPANTPITAAHIHPGAAGASGGALVSMGLGTGEIVLVNGAQVITKTNLGASNTAAQAQDIINNPGNYYFNVHSSTNPGGVARGQLVKQ